ncbi:citramalate synthase [Acidianus infernus]|uniref:Citramalate synthase n=1 Tax=Acidianus infernus TaxID=12915 RepID=A0A6A9QC63_ACIIN|nr:citramalate synthase [Acidianus infernus]MUM64801.1 citramalate synthase [Acidianus infernus]
MIKKLVEVLDTTLRDGAQTTSVSFTLNDKIRIALALDDLGVHYIEGGWPGSNPKDEEFFKEISKYSLKAKVAAFGSTKKKGVRADEDKNLNAIIDSGVKVAVLFGKSWTLHVTHVLKVSKEENLELVYDSIRYLRDHGLEVIFDAEHFYQGYKEDEEYALEVIKTAEEAGASVIALADTNGGTLPHEIYEITSRVVKELKIKVGLHMHNDSGCAVANTLMGVLAGARHVQGTINGLGERTGNADLVQVIPNLQLKMGFKVIPDLTKLKEVSRLVYELSGLHPNPYQPFVGDNAFSHKAGVHADAVMKVPRAYEHIDPTLVGNQRRIVISELAGSSNLLNYLEKIGIKVDKKDERLRKALQKIKEMENKGYSFDLAPASAVLQILKELGIYTKFIDLQYWKVINESGNLSLAVVKVNSQLQASEGVGPVHALDMAVRNALQKVYPELSRVKLIDYRVVLPGEIKNTESLVRVTIEFTDGKDNWRTEGVSTSVIEASVIALIDGLDYYLQVSKKLKTEILN